MCREIRYKTQVKSRSLRGNDMLKGSPGKQIFFLIISMIIRSKMFYRYRSKWSLLRESHVFWKTELFMIHPREMSIKSAGHVAPCSIVVFKENLALPRRKCWSFPTSCLLHNRARNAGTVHPHNRAANPRNRRSSDVSYICASRRECNDRGKLL